MDINHITNPTVTKQVYKGHGGPGAEEVVEITYPATEVVGHGSFGVVFTTVIEQTGEKVAIKKVLQDRRFKNRELEIMKLLQHTNVVDLRYHFYESEPQTNEVYLNLILEYMPQSLYQRLRHFVTGRLLMPRDEIKVYMFQLFKSLNYLHRVARVCHRDIKPQNLLVDAGTLQLKLCDFGSAKQLRPTEPNVSYICSRYYRAPELIFGATNYTTQIDIWSTGCVMAELLLGQPMFPGESGIDQLVEIIKILGTPTRQEICAMNENYSDHKFPQIKPIPLSKVFKREDQHTVQLLNDVLQYDPTRRFNALMAMCSSYFDEITGHNTEPETAAPGASISELWQGVVHSLQLLHFKPEEFNDLNDLERSLIQNKLIAKQPSNVP
ncbi:AaceriADR253Wp [[Ashbya] aceris (nom. inval.)]|nr:AaceriADR253Wp [[Ashbya] aceris (nom. inval.)]